MIMIVVVVVVVVAVAVAVAVVLVLVLVVLVVVVVVLLLLLHGANKPSHTPSRLNSGFRSREFMTMCVLGSSYSSTRTATRGRR